MAEKTAAAVSVPPPAVDARADEIEEESDPLFHPDAEEAAICLSCGRLRCFLDDDLPCRRYDRAIRALRTLRGQGEEPGEPGERGERTKEKGD